MVNYIYQVNGIGIYYVENLAKIGDFVREIKPQIFNTVPRLSQSHGFEHKTALGGRQHAAGGCHSEDKVVGLSICELKGC